MAKTDSKPVSPKPPAPKPQGDIGTNTKGSPSADEGRPKR